MNFTAKKIYLGICTLLLAVSSTAQDKYYTKSGHIEFVSKGEIETIQARHKSVTCVLDSKTGAVQFSVLMKGFEFKKALMQEHFNENYVESDKYPKAEFRGQITNNNEIGYTKEGTYTAHVKGKLTLHGQTRDVKTDGKVMVKDGKLLISSTFAVQASDYNISIPALVKQHISNTVTITVNGSLEPLQ